jgi:hypothetical protein
MKKILLIVPVLFAMASVAQARSSYLVCESINHNFNRCYSNEHISNAYLDEQFSNSDCVRGSTWGHDGNSIWVDDGCRGRFRIENQPNQVVRDVVCESNDHEKHRCYVDGDISNVQILQQYSHAECEFGHTWAWDNDYLLVTDGCRGLFRIRYRSNR